MQNLGAKPIERLCPQPRRAKVLNKMYLPYMHCRNARRKTLAGSIYGMLPIMFLVACGGGTVDDTSSEPLGNSSSDARATAMAVSRSDWRQVSTEGRTFNVTGTLNVRYGTAAGWISQAVSGAAECSNAFFKKDPIVGTVKVCEADFANGVGSIASTSGTWQPVTTEGSSFVLASAQTVRYGVDSRWVEKIASRDVVCSNEFFAGDPAIGVPKSCDILTTGASLPIFGTPGVWTQIALEGGNFSISGRQRARYGANGLWKEAEVGGAVPCTNDNFGDPIVGIVKSCQVLNGSAVTPVSKVSINWASPSANSKVRGITKLTLLGAALKNVEIFNGSSMVARATVSTDGTSATASFDVTKFANGPLTLSAHAWNSAAGTSFTSDADAGTISLTVENTSAPLLGVYVGNSPADVTRFESWMGRKADGVLGYAGNASWSDFDGSVGWAISIWKPIERRIFWSIPLIVNGATLREAANGSYDGHYTMAAQQLVKFRPQDSKVFVRTGWEFNGGWFPWSAAGQPENFIGAYRRFVNAFRAVAAANGTPDRFVFEWNVSIGDNGMNPELAYPGDDYVDIIGMDIYWFAKPRFNTATGKWEQWDPADPIQAWNKQISRTWGLNWHKAFAAQHKKQMAYSEWGVETDAAGSYIDQMAAWMSSTSSVYQTYWDSSAAYTGILSTGANPATGQSYKKNFNY